MKSSILAITLCLFTTASMLTSCYSPAEKVENAQDKVDEAKKDLDIANKEYLADIESYRKATADKIATNQKSIAEFNERISKEKKMANEDYKKKIAELDKKNSDMKKRLDDYQADGKEQWENFKREFSRDMEELGQSFKDFFYIK